MDEKEVKSFVKSNMVKNIDSVVKGEKNSVKILYVRPNDVIEYLESLGHNIDKDIDTNGWQWDYWITFDVEGNTYILSGDGYYYDSVQFSLHKD